MNAKETVKELLQTMSHKELNTIIREVLSESPKEKVVVNECYGGFYLSEKALAWLESQGESREDWECSWDIQRTHPLLIQVVELLGEEANGDCSSLTIVEVPSGAHWRIDEYDGMETVKW